MLTKCNITYLLLLCIAATLLLASPGWAQDSVNLVTEQQNNSMPSLSDALLAQGDGSQERNGYTATAPAASLSTTGSAQLLAAGIAGLAAASSTGEAQYKIVQTGVSQAELAAMNMHMSEAIEALAQASQALAEMASQDDDAAHGHGHGSGHGQ